MYIDVHMCVCLLLLALDVTFMLSLLEVGAQWWVLTSVTAVGSSPKVFNSFSLNVILKNLC